MVLLWSTFGLIGKEAFREFVIKPSWLTTEELCPELEGSAGGRTRGMVTARVFEDGAGATPPIARSGPSYTRVSQLSFRTTAEGYSSCRDQAVGLLTV